MIRLRHPRFLGFAATLALGTGAGLAWLAPDAALILGFDLAAAAFLASALPIWIDDHPDRARARSQRDDVGRGLLLVAAGAVLVVMLLALWRVATLRETTSALQLAGDFGTLLLGWLFANTVLAFHYAHLFYDQSDGRDSGGIAFPGDQPPVFADFVYFAFVIGMTAQTADLVITARRVRRVATVHGLAAFLFNLLVITFCINTLSVLV